MRNTCSAVLIVLFLLTTASVAAEKPNSGNPLFDGKTLKGWEGNLKWFRVEDGAIVAGSTEEKIPNNDYVTVNLNILNLLLIKKCTPK